MSYRVGVIGAAGVFGSRVAERLAATGGIALVMAGRDLSRAQTAAAKLRWQYPGRDISAAVLDRTSLDAEVLRALALDVVIDAAGPFQGSNYRVVEAAIAARCHYVDLADARGFVAGVGAFDAAARAANVAVISGASSTPALSHAALDRLTKDWRRIDTVRAAISPGNRVPRGLSVLEAILSWAGQPLRVFREGGWQEETGWGETRRMDFPRLGPRLVSLADTPDLDLLAARYRPRVAAEFLAGLELPILHRSLAALGVLVRWCALTSLRPFARPMRFLAGLLWPFGSDRGGMIAEAKGIDREGKPVRAVWSLFAPAGAGPNVPALAAAAVIRKLQAGALSFCGAAPCVGMLTLVDFAGDFAALGIETGMDVQSVDEPPLFTRAIGTEFERLPDVTRAIHQPLPVLVMDGRADVTGGATWLARAIAAVFSLPVQGKDAAVHVVIEADGAAERWSRVFPNGVMRSVMHSPDAASKSVWERFGWLDVRLRIEPSSAGLSLVPIAAKFGPIPLPSFLLPYGPATETVDLSGRHLFDVEICLPLIGRLVHYRGWLAIRNQMASGLCPRRGQFRSCARPA